MQDFGTKADNSPPPGGQLSAAEFNNLATESENAVLRSGQTLSGASDTQLAQSLFLHSVKAESFQDSGAANAYVATPVSGTNGVLLPADYTNLNGSVISFKAAFSNTTASTLNIGQTTGTLLGTKPIRTSSDTAIPSGTIILGQYVQLVYNAAFDGGSGAWEVLPWVSRSQKLVTFSTVGVSSWTVPAGVTSCIVHVTGGGGGGGGSSGATGSAGGGGGAAATAIKRVDPTGISSVSVTIAAGGAGGVGAATGSGGGTTSFGALASASGGSGGLGSAGSHVPSGAGSGVTTGADITVPGGAGKYSLVVSGTFAAAGIGGDSLYGRGSSAPNVTGAAPAATNGTAGTQGAGGSGGASYNASSNGGAGGAGFVAIYHD